MGVLIEQSDGHDRFRRFDNFFDVIAGNRDGHGLVGAGDDGETFLGLFHDDAAVNFAIAGQDLLHSILGVDFVGGVDYLLQDGLFVLFESLATVLNSDRRYLPRRAICDIADKWLL